MPKYALKEVKVGEVSLVDKAANKRKFLLVKSEEGGKDMPKSEVILTCEEGQEEFFKALAEADVETADLLKSILDAGMDVEEIKKAGMSISPKGMKAVKAALAVLKEVKDELPKDIMEKLSALGGYAYPQKAKADYPMEPGKKDQMKKSEDGVELGGFVIRKNEDGSADLSDVPENVRPLVKSLWYQSQEAIRKAEAAEQKAEEERDTRLTKEFAVKAGEYKHLAVEADKFGPVLKALDAKLSAEEYMEVTRVLKAADEALGAAELMKEQGKDLQTGVDDTSAYAQLCKAADTIKVEDKCTFEEAFVKAMDRNPELAAKERAER